MKADIETFCRKAKKLSPRTRELYGAHLKFFVDWCGCVGVKAWEEVTPDMIERFLESKKTWGSSMRWSAVCALRKFFSWKYGENHPICSVTIDREASKPQRTLNRRKANQLLALFDTTKPKGIRDLAICALALDTGLRADELVSIDLDHLDMDGWCLFVKVKGGEWEAASFFEYTASCLAHWLGIRDTCANAGIKSLFVSVGGLTPGQPITRDGLRAIFRRFSIDSEVGLVSPHDLRRTFATLAVEAGAPDRAVMVAGRWKSEKMVILYTRALRAKVLHPYSPMNNLMGVKPRIIKER